MHVVVNRWPRFQEGPRRGFSGRFEEFVDHEQHQAGHVVDAVGTI